MKKNLLLLLMVLTVLFSGDRLSAAPVDANQAKAMAESFLRSASQNQRQWRAPALNQLSLAYTQVDQTSGKNAYGAISMLVGVEDGNLGQFILLEDTQTFASTLEDNYVSVYNAGEREYSDVSCGATYGAKLIRDMASEALEDYEGRVL